MTGQTERRSVVLVTVDSLRADHCSGPDAVSTPALDALAASGARFENAVAPGPATYESMPTVFTGTDPVVAGARGGVAKRERLATHLGSHRTLAAALSERGYSTVGVTPNPFTSRHYGFDAGFDRFEDFLSAGGVGDRFRSRLVDRWVRGEFVGGLRFASNLLGVGDVSVPCTEVVDRAMAALDDEGPVFLWLMFLDPHWPYRPPPGYREGVGFVDRYRANWRASNFSDATPTATETADLRSLYRGTVRQVDDCIGDLRDRLAALDPVFVVHADHGEAFGEHGAYGHGGGLYEENVRVPLVVGNLAGESGDETVLRRPASLRDLPALVSHLAAGGTDLRQFTRDWVRARSERGDACVRGDGAKFYVHPDGDVEFFDLAADPAEASGVPVPEGTGIRAWFEANRHERSSLADAVADGALVGRL